MTGFVAGCWRLLRQLPLVILAPLLLVVAAFALLVVDLLSGIARRLGRQASARMPAPRVSIVIPNWNGRDLLEKYLPSVVEAAERHPGSEIIVVDNGSTDG